MLWNYYLYNIWLKAFKNGPSKIFLKAVLHKFYLFCFFNTLTYNEFVQYKLNRNCTPSLDYFQATLLIATHEGGNIFELVFDFGRLISGLMRSGKLFLKSQLLAQSCDLLFRKRMSIFDRDIQAWASSERVIYFRPIGEFQGIILTNR